MTGEIVGDKDLPGDDFGDDIARIEARIETLSEQIERCRKIALAARIAIGGGAAWIALVIVSLIPFEAGSVIAAIAAVLGGAVLLGSNSSTWTETAAALHASEALRMDLIGRMQLRLVGDDATRALPGRTLH
jgi:hypothetical protein